MRPVPSTAAAGALSPASSPAKCDAHTCPWWPYSNSEDFKANTALIIVILICALICGLAFNAAIRYVIRANCNRRRRSPPVGNEKAELDGGTAEIEAEASCLVYAEGMKLAGAEFECIICLTEFEIGDKIRVLDECGHGFHVECVQKWLVLHSSCPTCRANCSIKS